MARVFQYLLNHPGSLQNKTAANWLREPFIKLHESTLPKKNSRICSVFQAPLRKKICYLHHFHKVCFDHFLLKTWRSCVTKYIKIQTVGPATKLSETKNNSSKR